MRYTQIHQSRRFSHRAGCVVWTDALVFVRGLKGGWSKWVEFIMNQSDKILPLPFFLRHFFSTHEIMDLDSEAQDR